MKIVDLEYTPVFFPIEAPLRYSQGAHPGFSRIIVQLKTDEGLIGLGECYGGKSWAGQWEEFRASRVAEGHFLPQRLRSELGFPGALHVFGHFSFLAAPDVA